MAKTAAIIETAATAIVDTLERTVPPDADVSVIIAALGTVLGVFAGLSGDPAQAMALVTTIVSGVVSGDLLDDDVNVTSARMPT